jgi:cell division protein FtsN
MTTDTPRRTCPLCKRLVQPSGAPDAPGTKLCPDCIGLVRTAFPASAKLMPRAQEAVFSAGLPAAQPMPASDEGFQRDGLTEDSSGYAEGGNVVFEAIDTPPSALIGIEQPGFVSAADAFLDDPPIGVEHWALTPEVEGSRRADEAKRRDDAWQEAAVKEPALEAVSAAAEAMPGDQDREIQKSDYADSMWPVLVTPTKRRAFIEARASMVILALLASAAALYYLVIRPTTASQPRPPAINQSARPPAAAGVAVAETQTPNPESTSNAPASVERSRNKLAASEETSSLTSTGRFSLQAAAFPVQAGAEELAEKLRRAGVPAYVVSADMGKRGIWYRVRVGRFETAEEAKRYSNDAQLRGKSVGITLQLIVCQYERP